MKKVESQRDEVIFPAGIASHNIKIRPQAVWSELLYHSAVLLLGDTTKSRILTQNGNQGSRFRILFRHVTTVFPGLWEKLMSKNSICGQHLRMAYQEQRGGFSYRTSYVLVPPRLSVGDRCIIPRYYSTVVTLQPSGCCLLFVSACPKRETALITEI